MSNSHIIKQNLSKEGQLSTPNFVRLNKITIIIIININKNKNKK